MGAKQNQGHSGSCRTGALDLTWFRSRSSMAKGLIVADRIMDR